MDYQILDYIQSLRTPFLDEIMPVITHLGSGGFVWIFIVFVLLCFKKYRKTGIVAMVALIIGTLIFTFAMKNIVARERPFNQEIGLLSATELLIPPPSDKYSFPSGHTLSGFAVAVSVFMYKKRFGAFCLVLAALIAFSRLYLYVHFPSDIVFGAIFGTICAGAADKIVNKVMEKYNENKLSDNTGQGNTGS